MAEKVENKKIAEYENENYYFLWFSDRRHFPYNCLGLSDEDNSVSRTDNFVNVNVFNSVTSSRVLSYPKSKLCKKRRINTQPLPPMPAILGDSTGVYHSSYTESVMLGPRFVPESVFYTQSVMLSPRFIPESVFYTQSVVRSP